MSFEMKAGDTKRLHVSVKDKEGAPVDLTESSSIRFWTSRGDLLKFSRTPVLQKSLGDGIEEVALLDGQFIVNLDPIDTRELNGVYYCEIEVIDASGNVSTPVSDTITITKDLIR